jgi:2-polyprenyl-3-methyl-5-hydroxy-6-metoxy-1,4-benzoquinol methylase
VAFIRRYVPEGGTLLDVGCGTGHLAHALAEGGYRVAGTDASLGMLRVFRERSETALVAARSDDLPFPDGTFDGVLCVALLHHVAEPERVAGTIREMVRVTRPGGHTVLWDHNPLNPYWGYYMKRVPQDSGDERLVPKRELLAALKGLPAETYRLGFTPNFAPKALMGLDRVLEAVLERVPGVRELAAHNVVVVRKPG